MLDLAVVILAAGKGVRMNSKKQKILHAVGGAPMVAHLFEAAVSISQHPPVLVIGEGGEQIQALFGQRGQYVAQTEKLGTGHATQMAMPLLAGQASQVAVCYADMPLLRAETIWGLAERQAQTGAAVVLMSVRGTADSAFGRVVRDANGRVTEIVEAAQARQRPNSADLLAITEQNGGAYCFEGAWLWQTLPQLPPRTARDGHTEYYLTDVVEAAVRDGRLVEAILTDDPDECLGAGTRAELIAVDRAFRRRTVRHWLANGVTIIDPATTYIDPQVQIGQDTIIWPNSYLQGETVVGEDCVIGPNTILRNAFIGHRCTVEQVVVDGRTVADNSCLSSEMGARDGGKGQMTHDQ
ncbi:MAG: NTP transferase domain-containing protein [Chloroflexi bacterium]|nr:NTP transferase domain-containing protein [Chloroflexota bacterium]